MSTIKYRDMSDRHYKYVLFETYQIQTSICPEHDLDYFYVQLSSRGVLTIQEDYAWDGPSGPAIDTKNFMRGSLVHDALYQLMRLGALDAAVYRKQADDLLRTICLEDGMSRLRAWWVYVGVRAGAAGAAKRINEPEIDVVTAP
jgi:hypothetical protein